jgi:AraC family transcriptional regulator
MILTTLPDLPPRPETSANAAFRRQFYARWGVENAIVCGHGTHAEYAAIPQALSIKMTLGGRERYFLPRRELVVDDDNLLVLNEGACYGSLLQAQRPAWTFAIFFRPGLADEVAAQHARSLQAALDGPAQPVRPVEFAEHLRPHQGVVSEQLKRLALAVCAGEREEDWLEEQLTGLLAVMLAQECDPVAMAAPRPALRAELHRRLRLAGDLIESHYTRSLTLDDLADVAHLSRFHFVREFARLYGMSPHAYLTRKRAHAALRLMASGTTDAERVAQRCGFGSRWSLQRALARHRGGSAQFVHPGERR